MNEAQLAQTGSEAATQQRAFWSRRLANCLSIVWVVAFLLVSWLLSSQLGIIREFEPGIEFDAHNRIHWFRPIAFFWFDRFSVLPSVGLAAFVCGRHAFPRDHGITTWLLAVLSAFLLGVGGYTVWEQLAFMHQFTH